MGNYKHNFKSRPPGFYQSHLKINRNQKDKRKKKGWRKEIQPT